MKTRVPVLLLLIFAAGTLGALPAEIAFNEPLTDIVIGPDGNLWTSGQALYRVDLSTGALTRFALPSGAGSIVVGPDGNFWLAGFSKVFKVTTSGVATTYLLSKTVYDLTVGPDGNIWFAGQSGFYGRITMSGSVTEYSLPANSFNSIASANGSIWLGQFFNDRVIRVDPISGNVVATISMPVNNPFGLSPYIWVVIPHPQGGVVAFNQGRGYWIGADNTILGTLGVGGEALEFDANGRLWFAQIGVFGVLDGTRLFVPPGPMKTPCGETPRFRSVAVLPDGNVVFVRTAYVGGCVVCDPHPCIDSDALVFTSFAQLSAQAGVPDAPISPAALAALAILLIATAVVRLR